MEPRGPRDAVVFTDDFEIESFIDSVLEVRESAVAGKEHYDADRPGARDMVSAIVSGAFVPVFGTTACRDLAAQAARISSRIALEHPFSDGNKRTALLMVGVVVSQWGDGAVLDESVDSPEFFDVIQAVAQRSMGEDDFAEWVRGRVDWGAGDV